MPKITKEKLRYEGSRDIPKPFPAVNSERLNNKGLVDGLSKGMITLKQAAFLLQGAAPEAHEVDVQGNSIYDSTYGWLLSEYKKGHLFSPAMSNTGEVLFTPGSLIRHMWDQHRKFPLDIWALYDHLTSDTTAVTTGISNVISDENYKAAARLIWEKFPRATKPIVIDLLMRVQATLKHHNNKILNEKSGDYLNKLLKGISSRGAGRSTSKEDLTDEQKGQLINEVAKFLLQEQAHKS